MKTNLFSFLSFLALIGCSDYEFEASLSETPNHADIKTSSDDNSAVTKDDIRNIVSIFGNGCSDHQSRAVSDKDYTLSTIYDSLGNPAIYVVNYADNGGFVLVSATKDYHPILAYAETGNYDITRFQPSGLDIWEKNTIDAVEEAASLPTEEKASHNLEWLRYSTHNNEPALSQSDDYLFITDEEYQELTNIYSRFIINTQEQRKEVYPYDKSVWQEVLHHRGYGDDYASNVYWMYEDIWQDFATLVYWSEGTTSVSPETVQSTWHQHENYNIEYKCLPDGTLPYAGCGPIAAGQIMRYFQHPTKYDWEQMPLYYATSTTSNFLFDIAESARAVYGNADNGGGTTTNINNMRNVFVEYGYNADNVKTANEYEMTNSLMEGSPVYIRGDDGQYGHAWVATKVSVQSSIGHYDIYNFTGRKSYQYIGTALEERITLHYFYFNWGWNGSNDGYYFLNTSNYNKNMKVILNIKPK